VSSQVAALMADKAKLVARSQLPVELAPRPLGTPAAAAAAHAGGSDVDEGAADGGRGGAGRRERARDAETYDEGDFYQQLLKELLESGEGRLGASGGGNAGLWWCLVVAGWLGRMMLKDRQQE
jgi:protein AATF/BFR2